MWLWSPVLDVTTQLKISEVIPDNQLALLDSGRKHISRHNLTDGVVLVTRTYLGTGARQRSLHALEYLA